MARESGTGSRGTGRGSGGRHHRSAGAARRSRKGSLFVRYVSATAWSYLVWNLLTWTATAENFGVGAGVALLVALAHAAAGEIVAPWRLADHRRLGGIARLVGVVTVGIARENLRLAARIWAPSRPLRSGMLVAPTQARTDGELSTVGLATSLIVDNQIIDLDRVHHRLQFHGVALPPRGLRPARRAVNGPVERPVLAITRRN